MCKLEDNKVFLRFMLHIGPKQFSSLLKNLTDYQLMVIIEIITNLLKGNIILTQNQLETLTKYRFLLRSIRDTSSLKKIISKNNAKLYKIFQIIKLPFLEIIPP